MSEDDVTIITGAVLILCVALQGCAGINALLDRMASPPGATPVVKAEDGGTAGLTVVTCGSGVTYFEDIINTMVHYQSPIVTAQGGASARMEINACGPGGR